MKSFPVLSVIFFLAVQATCAQVFDDFSDADLSSAPTWSGTVADFTTNSAGQLQLSATAAGRSWLATAFSPDLGRGIEWQFFIRQSFSASGANYGRFYLMSDQADLSAALNGYYLQFGEAGSNDAVELFRQSGTTHTSIGRAPDTSIADAFELRVKVIRSEHGLWELYVDYSGGTQFVWEAGGSEEDAGVFSYAYSGILCTYTISNAARFYFDDLIIKAVDLPDTRPPQVLSVEVASDKSLKILFSEVVGSSSEDPRNYFLSPSNEVPYAAVLMQDQRTVILSFQQGFTNGVQATLHAGRIQDVAGNTMVAGTFSFLYFVEEPVTSGDIIITEIFADPTPQIGLPDAEFVELYNRSEKAVDLSMWVLSDESNSTLLPHFISLPGTYLILTSAANAPKFNGIGTALGVSHFPAFNNSGDLLTLKDDEGLMVDSLYYSASWYGDEEKAEGGWSLERIDPQNICADADNWLAADAPAGGTPGEQNSVYATKPDNTGPSLTVVVPLDSITLLVTFNEKLDRVPPSPADFKIHPALNVSSVRFVDLKLASLLVTLSEPVVRGVTYAMTVVEIYDCSGNIIREEFSHATFLLPELAQPGDVVVNEVLFNPRPAGADFVEIFNRSAKVIDLKNWSIRNHFTQSGTNEAVISVDNLLLKPGQYLVFTRSKDLLKGEYIGGAEETFLETELPALNDEEGSVALLTFEGIVIDSAFYTEAMHSPFLKLNEGVSLERIDVSASSTQLSNWKSASSSSGFATPGYANSNMRSPQTGFDGQVDIDPEIIQPLVAHGDFAQINYQFPHGGLIANVKVFDQHGRAIREIASNELLGTRGFFRWDGDFDDGTMAGTGYYMVWFEVFDAGGTVKTFRRRVAIF